MKTEFENKKQTFYNLDKSIVDIQIMGEYGNRWNSGGPTEMILRIVYKGNKRLITTIHQHIFENELRELIGKTRAYFRQHKLERILDGDV